MHVSRTGGVSIRECLRTGLNEATSVGSSLHAPLCEARDELGELFDSTFKFAVVRNPWDRLVSWHSYISSTAFPDLDHESLSDPDASHWTDFDAYLDAALKETWTIDGEERLVASQFHQLADAQGRLLTDDLGRFEILAEDLSRLLERAKLRCPPLKRMNQSYHQHYSVYFSAYGRQLVESCLPEDIAQFGYRFGP